MEAFLWATIYILLFFAVIQTIMVYIMNQVHEWELFESSFGGR